MSIVVVPTLDSIDHTHITDSVYGDKGNVNQGNNSFNNTPINQSKVSTVETVVLYRPYALANGEGTNILVENETVVFSGFVQSETGLQGNNVSLYELSKEKENLLDTYTINDPVSTQFAFKVKITPELVKNFIDSGNQLQFKAYHSNVSSNIITVNTLLNKDEESKYRQVFDPQKNNIPEKVALKSTYAGKISDNFAYLYRYELVDENSGNVLEFVNTEDDVDRFDTRREYNLNLTSGSSIVSLKFEGGDAKPLFLDMSLLQFETLETINDGDVNESIPVLYRFDTFKDENLKFQTPLVEEGVYSIEIKVFFDNSIRATYVLSKIGVWLR